VDASIVVLENIFRHREAGRARREAAVAGTAEVVSPIVASTVTSVVVFLPIIVIRGEAVTTQLYYQFAVVVVFALACSLLVAMALTPVLASWLPPLRRQEERPWTVALNARYREVLRWALRHRPLVLGAAAALFVLALAAVVLGALVVWPSAQVRLVPISRPVGAVMTLVADPGAQEVDAAAGVVPARYLSVEVEGEAHITTTGVKDIPDAPARGRVVFTNLMPQPLTVLKGTIVRTNAGVPVRFATLADAEVPANGQTMVEVEALDKGPAGNVAAGVISRIEGALAFQLRVTNPEPTQGGAARQVRAVTQADQDRLQAALLEQLQAQALEQMRTELRPTEFVVTPSLQLVDVLDIATDRYIGEQAEVLGMQMRVRMQAIAVDEAPAHQLALAALQRQVIPGYTLIASSVTPPRRGDTVSLDEQGRVTFRLAVSGAMTAQPDLNEAIRAVRGQPLARARALLMQKLPLERPPDIQVSPPWFPYMPFLGVRITVDLTTMDDG